MEVDSPAETATGVGQGPSLASASIPARFRCLREMWDDEDGLMEAVDAVLAEVSSQQTPSHSGGAGASSHSGKAPVESGILPQPIPTSDDNGDI